MLNSIENYPHDFNTFKREAKGKKNIAEKLYFLFMLNGFFPLVVLYFLPSVESDIWSRDYLYAASIGVVAITFLVYSIMGRIEKYYFKNVNKENIVSHVNGFRSNNPYKNCKTFSEVISIRMTNYSIVKSSIVSHTNVGVLMIGILFGINYEFMKVNPVTYIVVAPAFLNMAYLYLTRMTDDRKHKIFNRYLK